MSRYYDVIIIGGGIMGCSAAFQLAQRGVRVALLEKGVIGAGSTGESSAIIRQHYSNELTARMALYSLGVFQHFDGVVGGESGFTPTGFLALTSAADKQGLEANIALQRSVGIHTELLSAEAIQELMPGLALGDVVAGAYEPDAGYADPNLTVNSYAHAARREGADIFTDTTVTGIVLDGDRVQGVRSSKGIFNAPRVLNCAGPWSAQVARMMGVEAPINACRVQVSFFRRPPAQSRDHPVVADFVNAIYFRSETGNLTLVGLIDPAEADAVVDPDHYKTGMDDEFVLDSGERLVTRFPAMEQSQVTGGYASVYAVTPDWHPIVDELVSGSGFYICAGFSGHGFKLGPAVGLMVADMLTGAGEPAFDPHLFRLRRYEEGAPVTGEYEYSIVG
ncbi:MAG TPA: FAD-binding oxidoreductase [Candidatus Sulfomarinibacteraceae bacterium]|nr:FAD-binding oxidoreductase [Candidatus Sulfomarinibacteraceae bacterium]